MTLPPTLAGRLEYEPILPPWRDQLTQRLPAGSVIKLYAVYDEPFWRNDGLTGQAASDQGPIKVTFDNSPPGGTPGVLMGFMEANDGRRASRLTLEERKAAAIGCFVRYFGPRAAHPGEYLERDWTAEEFSRGCYGAHFTPGVWGDFGAALTEPVGRLHWAGAECQRGVERLHGGRRPVGGADRRRRTGRAGLTAPGPAAAHRTRPSTTSTSRASSSSVL